MVFNINNLLNYTIRDYTNNKDQQVTKKKKSTSIKERYVPTEDTYLFLGVLPRF